MTLIAIAHLPTEDTTLMNIAKKLGTTKQTANKLISSLAKKDMFTLCQANWINVQSILRLPLKEKSVNFLFRKIHLFFSGYVS